MYISPIETMFLTYQGLQLLNAIAEAMPKPKKEGWYSFFWLLIRGESKNLDQAFEQKYHVAVPRITDATPLQIETAPLEVAKQNPTQG